MVPISQCTGNSARASGADCRHLALQPRLRLGVSHLPTAGAAFFPGRRLLGASASTAGFSRPSMAVASRLICPTNSGVTHCATKAWWTFSPKPDLGKFPEGPRKGGLGGHIGPPHKTAAAPKDRRTPQGLHGGPGGGGDYTPPWPPRPGPKLDVPSVSGQISGAADRQISRFGPTSKMLTNCRSFPVNGRSPHSSRQRDQIPLQGPH